MNPANNNANPNATATRAYFCPACGGANVDASALSGGSAKCNVCTWTGTVEELPTFIFQHDLGGTPEEVFRTFFLDVRKLLGSHFATQIGHMLIKWGFLDAPTPQNQQRVVKTLGRYVAAITKAAVVAIVEERKAMEKEKFREQPPAG